MRINLAKIDNFYKSRLGIYVQKQLVSSLSTMLESAGQKSKTCILSAASFPYMHAVDEMKRCTLQAYHDQTIWPEQGQGHYVMTDRTHWPYRAEDADFVVLFHDIEFAEDADVYLREAWRVLKGEGRLIILFPNRSGKWARYDNTPFGLGYPFTLEQMEKLLSSAHFTIDKVERKLFYGPYAPQSLIGRLHRTITEALGLYCLIQPGLYMICASKHIYAPTRGLGATAAEKAKQALFPKPTTTTTSSSKTGL